MNSLSKKRLFKGVISLLLTMILGLGIISVSAMATDDTTTNLEDEYINLAEKSGYTVNPETKVPGVPVNKIKINSEEVDTENLKLTKAGDYSIELGSDDTTYKYNVILYRRGDANIDSSRDVRDLVAMYKTEVHTKESEIRGADTNGDGNVDATDRSQIRQVLVEKVKPVTFFDYTRYGGAKEDVSASTTISVEKGKTYTLSFNYYVKGSGSVNLINAAKDWQSLSQVAFGDGRLTGDGTYTYTFTADHIQVIPVFQTHIPNGAPKFYVWDMQLVEEGSNANKIGEVLPNIFKGELADESLITVSDIEIDELYLPDVCIGGNTWLIDFSKYSGEETVPNAYFAVDLEESAEYIFSFKYCVIDKSTGTKVVNGASWNPNVSTDVKFDDVLLSGKGEYTKTFIADTAQVIPAFQSNKEKGMPQMYIWDVQIVKTGTETNLVANIASDKWRGSMMDAGLVTISDVDTETLQPKKYIGENTWLLDFLGYEGENLDLNAYFIANVESGSEYTFSFKYCVMGKSTGTKVINAAKEWNLGSSVGFDNNVLSGKGEYTTTFTADSTQVIPAFQTHTPYGTPQLYIWDIQLVKEGTETNLVADIASDKFKGNLVDAQMVVVSDVDTDSLQPPVTEDDNIKSVWMFDFKNYTGTEGSPGAYTTIAVEQGAEYTFSFAYCVDGATTGTTIINAKQAWGQGSSVEFTNNYLTGKGIYTITFTADTADVIPVFQTNTAKGTPQLYVWDMQLVKTGSETNLLADKTVDDFRGVIKTEGLITITEMDPSVLVPSDELEEIVEEDVWLFDFSNYAETEPTPNAYTTLTLNKGSEYTFSFEYHVRGNGTPKLINAAKEWQGASSIVFSNNALTGKGTYTFTFTADHTQIIPVFQTTVAGGAPQLYVWNMQLVKTGSETNLFADVTVDAYRGHLKDNSLISITKMDPTSIGWPYVWMFDFAGCTENYVDLNAFPTMSLEKGSEYTLSFDYCSEGIGTSSIINASEAWHKKSTVTFPNNRLTGKGTYTFTFVADLDQIIPVFQAYKGTNAPRLYVWNLSLFKTNSTQNLMADLKVDNFGGNLKTNNLLFRIKADTNSFVDMPVDYNTAILYNRQSSSYDVKAEARRNEILAMTDTVRADASKTTYYVSPNGNDNNDGTSKASAWRTLARVAKNTYNKGDAILFERGGVYRGNLVLTTGVKYGAYGSGSKPCIYGSAQNYARPWLWEETDQEYVWKIHVGEMGDIGNIVFNHGVKCGWKMLSNSLVKNFDFYHDVANRDLYLYYTKGNPGAAYDDIEICSNAHVLHGKKDTTNVTIENLCIKYGGAHGIVFNTGGDYNIIQGCEIGYIGGSLLADTDRDVRYGNGIEMLDNFMYTEIKNNWVYQCYDAGITQQSSNANGCTQRDSSVSNNLIEYCSYNIEYYVDQDRGLINDTVYENNILRFAGYGFGSLNRIGSDNSMDSNICSYVRRIKGNNFVIQNNVFDSPKHFQTTIGYPNDTSNFGPKITQNTYIQQSTNVAKIKVDGVTTTLTATDLQTLKDAIAKIDSNPKSVIWDE